MIEYVFRPIDKWPREFTKERKHGHRFYATERVTTATGSYNRRINVPFNKLIADLAYEVEKAGGKRMLIQLALEEAELRRDGLPRSDSNPKHPGVIVAFETKRGPIKMPCDAFHDWHDNVRAITLTLEHLRGVDRYGVSQHGEQYRGWTALPPGPQGTALMSLDEAASFLESHVVFIPKDHIAADRMAFETAYKIAAKKLHPDAGGDEEEFKKLQTAADVLKRHHGVSE